MNRYVQIAFFALIVTLCHSQKIALKRFSEVGYIGEISVGTPAQKFNVLFDTNAKDTMIMSEKIAASENLLPITLYSSSSSSSYTAIGTNIYSEYSFNNYADGFLSQDLLQIAGFSIPNQVFLEAIYASYDLFYSPFQGVVGLHLDLDNLNGYSKPLANLLNSKQISNNLFSFWYNKNSSSPNQGELYLGGINPALYTGSLKYTVLSKTTSWSIKADSVSINGLNYNKNFQVLISTEHNLIYGDSTSIDKIIAKLGISKYNSYYYVKQSQLANMPSIVFTINSNTFPLKPTEYTYNCGNYSFSSYGAFCLFGLAKKIDDQLTDSATWIFGNLFMKTYYSVFDITNKKIGFATAV